MTEPECNQLASDLGHTYFADVSSTTNYKFKTNTKMFELETTGKEWRQVMGVTYWSKTSGAGFGTITTEAECKEFGMLYGWKYGLTSVNTVSVGGWPGGCVHGSSALYWNNQIATGYDCGSSALNCIEKMNVHFHEGTPTFDLNAQECEDEAANFQWGGMLSDRTWPSGCVKWGSIIYYNPSHKMYEHLTNGLPNTRTSSAASIRTMKMVSSSECQKYAARLGVSFGTFNGDAYPAGCVYIAASDSLTFNSKGDSTTHCSDSFELSR